MKIWCFDHASLSYNIHSDLYFSKEEAQELVADLSWEFAHLQFNWIMQSAHATPKRAMDMTEFYQYWYKEVPKI